MNDFELTRTKYEPHSTYEWVSDGPIVTTAWPNLQAEWVECIEAVQSFGVHPNYGFDRLVYSVLAWELTKGCQRFGCLVFDNEWVPRYLGRKPDHRTRWEYEFETGAPWQRRRPFRTGHFVKRRSGLFRLGSVDDLCTVFGATGFIDHTSELNLYAVTPDQTPRLMEQLNRRWSLREEKVVSLCTALVTIVFAQENDYSHAIVLNTPCMAPDLVQDIVEKMKTRIRRLEAGLEKCPTINNLLSVLADFTDSAGGNA